MKTPHWQEVLEFWFGDPPPHTEASVRARLPLWFGKRAADDVQIHERFGTLYDLACSGGCEAWTASAQGALALIVVRDQFARVLHRGCAKAFSSDVSNLVTARSAVAAGFDRTLSAVERVFLYMPYMHSESSAVQDESVTLYAALSSEAPAAIKPFLAEVLSYAERHREIVTRFGRFPHRNETLGRTTSDDEHSFLQQPHSAF